MVALVTRSALALGMVGALWSLATPALAEEATKIQDDLKDKALAAPAEGKDKPKDGWTTGLKIGLTGQSTTSNSWVGSVDGTTVQLGGLLDGVANHRDGNKRWHNSLKIQHAQTRTPQIDFFVKSQDALDLMSTYLYGGLFDKEWIGAYARVRLQTQLVRGDDVRTDPVTVNRTFADGATTTEMIEAQKRTKLTRGFEPLVLNESIGLFAAPLDEKYAKFEFKVGGGSQQIFSSDGFALAGYDDDTKTVDLQQLQDAVQIGAEAEVVGSGEIVKNITWKGLGRVFQPFYSSVDGPSGVDAMNVELEAALSAKVSKFLSLDYVFRARRVPLVIDDWQVQSGVLATLAYELL